MWEWGEGSQGQSRWSGEQRAAGDHTEQPGSVGVSAQGETMTATDGVMPCRKDRVLRELTGSLQGLRPEIAQRPRLCHRFPADCVSPEILLDSDLLFSY